MVALARLADRPKGVEAQVVAQTVTKVSRRNILLACFLLKLIQAQTGQTFSVESFKLLA